MNRPVQTKVVSLPRRGEHPRRGSWGHAVGRLDARVAELERRVAGFNRRDAQRVVRTRFGVAAVVSLLAHAFVLFGLGFVLPEPRALHNTAPALSVVLVNAQSQSRPLAPDALAQHHLDGGGNTDARQHAQSPLPAVTTNSETAELRIANKRVAELEREAKKLLARPASRSEVDPSAQRRADVPEPERAPVMDSADLVQRSLSIARLEAQISQDWNAYQERPRRRFVGARTQEFRYARYVEDWRQKIERIGELNYPQAARDQRIYGSLVATVSIRADGSLEKVQIDRSSGNRLLDEATVRIVSLAAPFAALPPDITREVDILHITRTWTFTRADRFVSQ